MIDALNSNRTPARLLGVVVGLLIVAAAGAASLDDNRARFRLTSTVARRELAETLRRFDVELTDDEQRAMRSIDDRLNALPADQRDSYLSVLRRYHNWLEGLPERARDELLARPIDQRLAAIKPLIAKYPPPDAQTRSPVDFIQTGGTSVFEVASICKTWVAMSPDERQKVDALAPGARRAELQRLGRVHGVPAELKPADFNEAAWIARMEERLSEFAGGGGGQKEWIAKLESRINEGAAKRKENGRPGAHPLARRLAVNLYAQEHAPPSGVDPDRLTRFFEATPAWVQSTFNVFPSEEARRRLSLVYRLIYPAPLEFGAPAPSAARKPTSPPPRPSTATPPPPPPQPSKAVAPF